MLGVDKHLTGQKDIFGEYVCLGDMLIDTKSKTGKDIYIVRVGAPGDAPYIAEHLWDKSLHDLIDICKRSEKIRRG